MQAFIKKAENDYRIFSVIRHTPNFSTRFSSVDKLKIKPKYPAIRRNHDFRPCSTTTCFPMTLVTAIHLCEQKQKRVHISIKSEKITPINTKSVVFLSCEYSRTPFLFHKQVSCLGCGILTSAHASVVST